MIKEENEGIEHQEEEEWKSKYLKLVKSKNVSNHSSRARINNLTPDVFYYKTKISEYPLYSTPQKSVNSIITNKSFVSM